MYEMYACMYVSYICNVCMYVSHTICHANAHAMHFKVLLDGINIRDVPLRWLRSHIALVAQVCMFAGMNMKLLQCAYVICIYTMRSILMTTPEHRTTSIPPACKRACICMHALEAMGAHAKMCTYYIIA